jgi:AcrR family transcriptional regulator
MADQETDGRRRRTLDSRARIVAAMMELTRAGEISVSAEKVAEHAKVGLRTVFRHFKDMDSLYREMSLSIEARIRQELARPLRSDDWRGRLAELISRRTTIFETITPFKRAEAAHRHRSRFLEWDIQRLNTGLREILRAVLPEEIASNEPVFEALDLLLSFESWDRLRREQGLSARRAREVLEAAVAKLIA